jgi:two-component system LytT family sensor kinase
MSTDKVYSSLNSSHISIRDKSNTVYLRDYLVMKTRNSILRVIYHIAGWVLLYLLPPLVLQVDLKLPSSFGDFMYWSIVIVCFYVNYLWLIPKYLSKRRFGTYFLFILFMLVFTYSANEIYVRHIHNMENAGRSSEERKENEQSKNKRPRFRGYNSALFCFAVLALGTSIRVTENWYENEKQRKEMENQKLGAELSLLKSQINPHFFFNTLNSIYALAIIKSDKTPEAVIKLSEIMRYIIYDTERKLVPLSKEVEYIANYIELQRLRLSKQIKVIFTTQIGKEESVIEPLLLLPFVENAFKHGIDIEKGGQILISIIQTENMLHLHVENPFIENNTLTQNGSSGLGMNNTIKRLKLLYQDNFTLTSGPVDKMYIIDLELKLKEDEVLDS